MKKGKRKYVCSPMNCVICGYKFTPYSRKAMYCSNACKQIAYRRRLDRYSETYDDLIHYSNEENIDDPNSWMGVYMRKTNKNSLKEVSEAQFKLFPIKIQMFFYDTWVLDNQF